MSQAIDPTQALQCTDSFFKPWVNTCELHPRVSSIVTKIAAQANQYENAKTKSIKTAEKCAAYAREALQSCENIENGSKKPDKEADKMKKVADDSYQLSNDAMERFKKNRNELMQIAKLQPPGIRKGEDHVTAVNHMVSSLTHIIDWWIETMMELNTLRTNIHKIKDLSLKDARSRWTRLQQRFATYGQTEAPTASTHRQRPGNTEQNIHGSLISAIQNLDHWLKAHQSSNHPSVRAAIKRIDKLLEACQSASKKSSETASKVIALSNQALDECNVLQDPSSSDKCFTKISKSRDDAHKLSTSALESLKKIRQEFFQTNNGIPRGLTSGGNPSVDESDDFVLIAKFESPNDDDCAQIVQVGQNVDHLIKQWELAVSKLASLQHRISQLGPHDPLRLKSVRDSWGGLKDVCESCKAI